MSFRERKEHHACFHDACIPCVRCTSCIGNERNWKGCTIIKNEPRGLSYIEDNVNFRAPQYQEMPMKLVAWRTKVDTAAGKSSHCWAQKYGANDIVSCTEIA